MKSGLDQNRSIRRALGNTYLADSKSQDGKIAVGALNHIYVTEKLKGIQALEQHHRSITNKSRSGVVEIGEKNGEEHT